MPTPIRPANRARIRTFTAFEIFDQLQPGVWDAQPGPTAADQANQWLDAHPDCSVVDTPRFDSRLMEVTRSGNRRTYVTTLTFLYLSDQFEVRDARDGQEVESPQVAPPAQPAVGAGKFSRLSEALAAASRATGVPVADIVGRP